MRLLRESCYKVPICKDFLSLNEDPDAELDLFLMDRILAVRPFLVLGPQLPRTLDIRKIYTF